MSVGHELGVASTRSMSILKRIRQKYADAGRPTRTKLDLFKRAVEDGWLPDAAPWPRRLDRQDGRSTAPAPVR